MSRFRSSLVTVLLVGLTACGGGSPDPPTTPTPGQPPPPNQPVHYTAIGASDAMGIGGTVECFPLDPCPNGTGYVAVIARQLRATRQVALTNLAIPAGVTSVRIQEIGRWAQREILGNFIERSMPFVPQTTTLLTIFAGGNDVNAIASAIERGMGGPDPRGFIAEQIRLFGTDYDTLIRGVRQRAPSARIVVANLPNFAALPFTSSYSQVRKQVVQALSVGFSASVINNLTSQGVAVVDLLCEDRSYQAGNYSRDGYHPNDAGYAMLASLMLDAINSASYPAPRSSCAQMSVVPPL
jgi:lysophospholipase L1-like esterase